MKKNLIVLFSAALIALAVPSAAFAAPISPDTVSASANSVSAATGVTVSVSASGKVAGDNPQVVIEPAEEGVIASNTPADASVVASFEVSQTDTEPPYTFSYTLGTSFANASVTVYIEHEDGTTETVNRTADANGSFSFEQEKLSIHTIVAEQTAGTAAAEASVDTGAKSPQTGLPVIAVAAGTVAAALGAVAVARKVRL